MAENAIPEQELLNRVYKGPNKSGDNVDGLVELMYGYDYTNNVWRRVAVDASGNIGSGGGGGTVAQGAGGASAWLVDGNLTHNNAAPGATNLGVLPALGNASPPTFTEGDQVLLSTDLSGRLRVQGASTTGLAVTGIAVLQGLKDASGNLQPWSTSNNTGDGGGATSAAVSNVIYNGTTWDRLRSVINGTNSTGTGIVAAGLVAQFDDVSPTAITENQFGNIRMSANRNLYSTIRDAAGNERGVNVTAGNALQVDGSATTQPISAASLPLPTGAATAAKQDTGNTSLADIDTNMAYKFAPGKKRYTNIISASTSITPTTGKAIEVINVQVVPASGNAGDVQIYINFATSSIDVFKGYAGGGYGIFTGAVNEFLTITQTGSGSVQVLVDYLEV